MPLASDIDSGWVDLLSQFGSDTESYSSRVDELLNYPAERDVPLWESYGVNSNIVLHGIEHTDVVQRGDDWIGIFADVVAMARKQAFLEIIFTYLDKAQERSQALRQMVKGMSIAEVKDVATAGFDGASDENKETG